MLTFYITKWGMQFFDLLCFAQQKIEGRKTAYPILFAIALPGDRVISDD